MELKMKKEDLKKLAYLLTEFIITAEQSDCSGSMYGKKMDVAVAKDMMTSLLAYGLDYMTYATLKAHMKVIENIEGKLNDPSILIPTEG